MKEMLIISLALSVLIGACTEAYNNEKSQRSNTSGKQNDAQLETATFAGGCFWCMEHPFEALDGVIEVLSGYIGGDKENPTYQEICMGETGHLEAVQISFDSTRISYSELLDVFWKQIDPTDPAGQFVDKGPQYRTAIFYHNEEQKELAEASKKELDQSGRFDKPIVTEIRQATKFYKAEDYHQDYYRKCPIRYNLYKAGSGRNQYLEEVWKDSGGENDQ